MTIEQLLKCSAEDLERMSDVEIEKFWEPYLKFVRPPEKKMQLEYKTVTGQCPSTTTSSSAKTSSSKLSSLDKQMAKLNELAKQKGLL